jgi:hypothetical protein
MSNRFGKSHVDGTSEDVYKLRLRCSYFTGQPREAITLRLTRFDALEVIPALENDTFACCQDQRERLFIITRRGAEYEVDDENPFNRHSYGLSFNSDWGRGSWQQVLVHLKCWVGR